MARSHSAPADERSAAEWYQLGSDALRRSDLDTAERAFQMALAKDQSHANALYRMGELADSRDDVEAAVEYFRRALIAHPEHVGARKRLDALRLTRRPPARPSTHPPRPPAGKGIVGIVRNYQQRAEQSLNRRSIFVITFRVAVDGQPEAVAPALPVEMRGPELHGSIANGDWVELPKTWTPGRQLSHVHNLTTDQTVKFGSRGSHSHPLLRALGWVVAVVAVLWVITIFAVVIAGMLGADPAHIIETLQELLQSRAADGLEP